MGTRTQNGTSSRLQQLLCIGNEAAGKAEWKIVVIRAVKYPKAQDIIANGK